MGAWLVGQKDCPESLHATQGYELEWGTHALGFYVRKKILSAAWG
jgi:hypothetical protein